MALRFIDSFDHYLSGSLLRKWDATRNTSPSAFITGRFGSGWNAQERWTRKDFADSQATWIMGGAWQFGNGNGFDPTLNEAFMGVLDSGTLQCDLRYNAAAKQLYVTRGGTQLGSAFSFSPTHLQWYFIEFKTTIDNTAGIAVVRIDGTTVINLSGQDTQVTTNATGNMIRIGSHQENGTNRTLDDFYICDGTGSAPTNDFLGDIRIQARLPNGNGTTNNMVGSDGNSTDNYLLVDDPQASVDDDTTYTESSTVGDKDLYTYEDLTPASGTVYGVQILPLARKTDAGTRSIVSVARLSATETDGSVQTLGTTYQYFHDIRETKPGGGAWAISDVNSAEFGWKVNA